MATRIQLRRDTEANWSDANPTLAAGEAGYDITNNKMRVGDGERNWNALTPLAPDVDLSIYATKSALNTETATRAAADVQHGEDIEGLQMQIDALVPDDDSALTTRVTTLEGEMNTVQNQIQVGQGSISSLDERVTELEENGGGNGGGPSTTALNWTYEGTGFFAAPDIGGIKIHPNGISIYISKTNAAGDDIEQEILNQLIAGNLFSLQVPARTGGSTNDSNQYQQFSIQQAPVSQGDWFNVATQRIIDANSGQPWQAGSTSLDMVVQMAPQTRFLLTDPQEQPEDIITDEDLLQHWFDYKERQGWGPDYIPTQQDVNRYFNEVDQIQQETIRGQSQRLDVLDPPPPDPDDALFTFEFRGTTWWATPDDGELWLNNARDQLFISGTDEDGEETTAMIDAQVRTGTKLIFVQQNDPSKWVRYTATGGPVVQSGYRNVPVRQDGVSGVIETRALVALQIDNTATANVGFESSHAADPVDARVDQIEEAIATMRRDLTALKGQLTKLKKTSG